MKIKDLLIKVPALKPRNPNQAVLASKKNAGGPMKDKKVAMKNGHLKHKGRAYEDMDLVEASLGSRVPYDNFNEWFADLPNGASTKIDETTGVTTASTTFSSKHFEGVCGKFNAKKNTGWIYEHYLKKDNLAEGRRNVYGPGDEVLISHPNKTMQAIGNGEEVKVMTKSGVARITKVQFYNGGLMFKLDRKVKLADGEMGEWVADRDVSLNLSKDAAPDAKAFARMQAMGER